MLEPPEILYRGVESMIGNPVEYNYGNTFKLSLDYNWISDKIVYDNGYYP